MTKEEMFDWLYRLRSEIYVYMPKEWLIPMDKALDVAIDTVKREEMLEDWTKKCRKFEAEYENRLKADMVAMLEELKLEFEEYEPKWAENEDQVIASNRTWDDFDDIIQQKIDFTKGEYRWQ